MTRIRVLLADDHAILLAGLRALLSFYEDIEVVGEASDGAKALLLIEQLRPNVVLMDVAMPGMNGIEATRQTCSEHPDCRVLILSQHGERQYLLELLRAGASGYILKEALGSDLVDAIRAIARGDKYIHPAVAAVLVEEFQQPTEALTNRELEVLRLIVRGDTSSQVASALSLSIKTVEWHRNNLMSKLNVHNSAQLVRVALQSGLIRDEG